MKKKDAYIDTNKLQDRQQTIGSVKGGALAGGLQIMSLARGQMRLNHVADSALKKDKNKNKNDFTYNFIFNLKIALVLTIYLQDFRLPRTSPFLSN